MDIRVFLLGNCNMNQPRQEGGFQALRVLCAATMRAAPDDFAPFLDLAPLCRAEDKEGGAEAKAAA